jgi:hypothetical protein
MSIYTKTKQVSPQFGLAIDWETSGATWGGDSSKEYQGLSFGAVVFNAQTFEVVEKLYREIQFDEKKYKWSPEAEAIHGMSQHYLLEKGVTQEEAAIDLAELILKYWGPTNKVMFLGHNPEFDRRFTNQLTQVIGMEFSTEKTTDAEAWIQMHHVMLDTSALGFITLGLFKSDLLFDAVGLEERAEHNALTDALYTVETCARIRLLVQTALAG